MSELQALILGGLLLTIIILNLIQMRYLLRIRRRLRSRLP